MAFLIFLKNNWKSITAVLVVAGLILFGWRAGVSHTRLICEAEIQATKDAQQTEKDRLQAAADQKSMEYEQARNKAHSTLKSVKRRLTHEQAKNSDYNDCRAGDVFLQLYAETAATCAASNAAR